MIDEELLPVCAEVTEEFRNKERQHLKFPQVISYASKIQCTDLIVFADAVKMLILRTAIDLGAKYALV